jgi:hypothetical protein
MLERKAIASNYYKVTLTSNGVLGPNPGAFLRGCKPLS